MPAVALVDGALEYALDPNVTRAVCRDPKCAAPMYRRAAAGFVPHWAHNPGTADRCEADRHGETPWHLAWKQTCSDPNRVEFTHGNRRADVLTAMPEPWAIEFQHSNMRAETLKSREDDWRGRLIWVHDGTHAASAQVEDIRVTEDRVLTWESAPSRVVTSRCHQLIDTGDYLYWLPPSPQRRRGGELQVRCRRLTRETFIDVWVNGSQPWFPRGWEQSTWDREKAEKPRLQVKPEPRSDRLVLAMQQAVEERDNGTDEGVCDRATATFERPPLPCIDCSPTPRKSTLAAIPPGFQLCDEHWPKLSWKAS